MNRRTAFSLTVGFLAGAAVLASIGSISAQQADTDAVKAVIDGYHSALSALDVQKMDGLWAHDPYVVLINPRDKGISVGWDAVKKNWDATFAAWSELKVTQQDGPHIHVNGNVAWASGIALAAGKLKNGTTVSSPTYEIDVMEKRGNSWLLVSHTAVRVPQ